MCAKMFPSEINLDAVDRGSNEELVFNVLRDNLPDDYYVFYSWRKNKVVDNKLMELEADFIIYNRKLGILVIEVKNSNFFYDKEYGVWRFSNKWDSNGRNKIMPHDGPWAQAQRAEKELYKYMKSNDNTFDLFTGRNARCKVLYAVWLLQGDIKKSAGNWPAEADPKFTLFAQDLQDPKTRIEDIFSIDVGNPPVNTNLSEDDEKRLLENIFFSNTDMILDGIYEDVVSNMKVNRFLNEQKLVLDFTETQQLVAINGAAGTGKTIVAVEKARRLAEEGDSVLFLCFNNELQRDLEEKYGKIKNIYFKTINGFVSEDLCDGHGVDYERGCETLIDFCGDRADEFKYKHIIIDEGQDFALEQYKDYILDILYEIIKSKSDESCFYVFYDELQRINGASHNELPEFIKNAETRVTLRTNCRNTTAITRASLKPINVCLQNLEIGKVEESWENQKYALEKQHLPENEKNNQLGYIRKENERKISIIKRKYRNHFDRAKGFEEGQPPKMYFINDSYKSTIVNSVDKLIEEYLKESETHKLDDIAVLTCMPETSSMFNNEISSRRRKWQYGDETIRFMSVNTFKGLEAEFVILIEVSKKTFTDYAMRYYVGSSRAKKELAIITAMTEDDCKDLIINWLGESVRRNRPARVTFAGQFMKCNPKIDNNL